MKKIYDLIAEFNSGLDGEGVILFHKKPHKNGSGEFACLMGVQSNCPNPINCKNCYMDKTGGYCVEQGGISVNGFLVAEDKHASLIEKGSSGTYSSIKEAMESLN